MQAARGRARSGRRSNRRRNLPSGRGTIVSGTEEISIVQTGATAFSGGVFPLVPSFDSTTRLSQIAMAYSQYNIVSSTFTYIPQVGSTTNGRIAMAFAFDTRENPPTDVVSIIQMAGSRYGQIWRNIRVNLPPRAPDRRRFATINISALLALTPVEQQQYVPAVLVYGTDSSTNGLTTGSIVWNYRIRFFNPNMSVNDPSASSQGILRTFSNPDESGDEESE